ncbi:DUF202 domain-containing protein [Lysinimonas soli]|uniref:DUF202 domain-containing protein n=1 Tax=Lysinimonas soli TaxID=1074233 RepID=A0ABW0NSE0_9MICO
MTDTPFDAGLQPERTLLAWRRTSLSIGVGGLLFIRFAVERMGAAAILLGLLGLLLAVASYIDASRRYRRVHGYLTVGLSVASAAIPISLAAASVAVFAVACLAWLVVAA